MVAPEPSATPAPDAAGGGEELGSAPPALLGQVAAGIGIGAFVASLLLAQRLGLAAGARSPASSWLSDWQDWLPLLWLGFASGRLASWLPGARRGLALFAVAAMLAIAGWQLVGRVPPSPALLQLVVAAVLGVTLGLQTGAVGSRSVWPAALATGAVASSATLLIADLARPRDPAAVALAACLFGLLFLPRRIASHASVPLRWTWQLVSWTAVLIGVGVTGCQLAAVPGPQVTAAAVLAGLLGLVAAAAAASRVAIAGGATIVSLIWSFAALPPVGAPVGATAEPGLRELATTGGLAVLYRRADQELQLSSQGEVLVAAGPDRCEEPLAIALLHALLRAGDRVLLLGEGTGRIGAALQQEQRYLIDLVETWPRSAAVRSAIGSDGPVQVPLGEVPAAPLPTTARSLLQLPTGSRQLIVLGDDLVAATRHRATPTYQRQLRRVVGDGIVCQPLALDRVSPRDLTQLLAAVATEHAWNGMYAVGNAAVLVSATAQPSWSATMNHWSDDARWSLHAAHLGSLVDLQQSLLGSVRRAPPVLSERAAGDVAQLLLAWLVPPEFELSSEGLASGALPPVEPSVRRRWLRLQSELQRARARVLALPADAASRAEAQAIASRFLPIGAPTAWLQAALGLPDRDGIRLRDPSLASRCAHALDPTFFVAPAAVFAELPVPLADRGALEDLARVEVAGLARRCVGDAPQAVALRARFGSRCARALIRALGDGPLDSTSSLALRELADPFVLAEAARILLPGGRWRELLALWRGDLPMPAALLEIGRGAAADRRVLAEALRGRRDVSCIPLLADLLVDDDVQLRRVAGEVLRGLVGDEIQFDPEWPRSARSDAARRLRGLHNRKP